MCWNAGALQYVIKSIATPCFRTTVRKTVNFSDTKSRGEAVISCGAAVLFISSTDFDFTSSW